MLRRFRNALVVRPQTPSEVAGAVEAELHARARRRARTVAWAGLLVNLPLFYVDEYLAYAGGSWSDFNSQLLVWRLVAVLSLGAFLVLDRRTPAAPRADACLASGLAVWFSLLGGAFGMWVATNVPSVPLYAFSLLLVAVLVHPLGTRHLWLGYGLSAALMVGGALAIGTPPGVVVDWLEFPLVIVVLTTVVDRVLARQAYRSSEAAHLLARANERLERTLAELRETQGRLLDAERQAERATISRDLHDSVGAQLSNLLAGVELARLRRDHGQPAEADESDPLDALEADARATLRDLRETIWALQTDALSAEGLRRRIRQFAEPIAARAGLDLDVSGRGDAALTPSVALHLYRIAQEAVQNASKHSGGRRLTVRLDADLESLALTVADDGQHAARRPSTMQAPSGFGIGNMRARADELGAAFSLDTDAGTTVQVSLPLTVVPEANGPVAGSAREVAQEHE